MRQEEIDNLIEKYLHNTASPEERERLLNWYQAQNQSIVEWDASEDEDDLRRRVYEEIESAISEEEPKVVIGSVFYRLAAAAAILIILALGIVVYTDHSHTTPVYTKTEQKEDVLPGGNRATLTLADGTRIILDSAKNSVLLNREGLVIRKTADGQLSYTFSNSEGIAPGGMNEDAYNTIETPRGGSYRLSLPDGSQVYLNSSSLLKFPVSFGNNSRKVLLSGEAYFEISHDSARPFRVESGEQLVEVLGTHFNVNSYTNEPVIKTTLLQGSVKVLQRHSGESAFLKPGQEAALAKSGRITVGPADTIQTLGWKNGAFVFNDLQLLDIMRQLERWYNVEVDYSTIPNTRYNGVISRNIPLSKALKMLEVTGGVSFAIEGKTVRIIN